MATTQQLQAWLAEAEEARHELLIGRKTVTVSSNGKSQTYAQTDLGKLDAYIVSLRSQLGLPTGVSKPFTPIF
jgi:hypothetical protein